jgi:multicomponent Na+:H+ antiporter subunit E
MSFRTIIGRHASRGVLRRAAVLACLWLVLARAELHAPLLAVACVAAALAAGVALQPPRRAPLRAAGVARFVPYFLWQSLAGGFDVALRAFRSRRALAPAMLELRTRLPLDGAPPLVYLALVNMLPGTLCARLDGDVLHVHVIDRRRPNERGLRELEARVAGAFGVSLDEAPAEAR